MTTLSIAKDILETQIHAIKQTELAYSVQLLRNSDELARFLNDLTELSSGNKVIAMELLERMIKSPIRCQVGRLKFIRLALENSIPSVPGES